MVLNIDSIADANMEVVEVIGSNLWLRRIFLLTLVFILRIGLSRILCAGTNIYDPNLACRSKLKSLVPVNLGGFEDILEHGSEIRSSMNNCWNFWSGTSGNTLYGFLTMSIHMYLNRLVKNLILESFINEYYDHKFFGNSILLLEFVELIS